MSTQEPAYTLHATRPAEQQLNRLPNSTATAIVEFIHGALLDNPHRPGGALSELAGIRSARRGTYRIIYEIDHTQRPVIAHRIEHHATAYRPR